MKKNSLNPKPDDPLKTMQKKAVNKGHVVVKFLIAAIVAIGVLYLGAFILNWINPLPAVDGLSLRNPFVLFFSLFSNGFWGFLVFFSALGLFTSLLAVMMKRTKQAPKQVDYEMGWNKTYGSADWLNKAEMLSNFEYAPLNGDYKGILIGLEIDKEKTEEAQGIARSYYSQFNDNRAVEEEERQEFNTKQIIDTGRVICQTPMMGKNNNFLLIGAPGTGKTAMFCNNVLFQAARNQQSVICTDTKGGMYELYANYMRANGYKVYLLNARDPEYSMGWNVFQEFRRDQVGRREDTETLVNSLYADLSGSLTVGDSYWDDNNVNLLKALILYAVQHTPQPDPDNPTVKVGSLIDAISLLNLSVAKIEGLMLAKTGDWLEPYSKFSKAKPEIQGQIANGLGTKLTGLQNPNIKRLMSTNEIELEQIAKEKSCVFVVIDDMDESNNFLVNLFFNFACMKLSRIADNNVTLANQDGEIIRRPRRNEKELDYETILLMDEFCNLGLKDFEKKVATLRSRGIPSIMIVQSWTQLQGRYDQYQASALMGNCDYTLFLGGNDMPTAKMISERSGEATVLQKSVNETQASATSLFLSSTNIQKPPSEGHGEGKRALMTPHEVTTMSLDQALLFSRGNDCLPVKKLFFKRHPDYQYLKNLDQSPITQFRASYADVLWQPTFEDPSLCESIMSYGTNEKRALQTQGRPMFGQGAGSSTSFDGKTAWQPDVKAKPSESVTKIKQKTPVIENVCEAEEEPLNLDEVYEQEASNSTVKLGVRKKPWRPRN
ncbi:MAG: VirD4-like conjugal transfer protein, CD1115 family [Fastidiosipilaceae bacterium]|jgi:type IV secretory pathway TraG/TraD family ATPase VirD4